MRLFLKLFFFLLILSGCGSYKQNILFKLENTEPNTYTSSDSTRLVAPGDYLEMQVFTNKGEKIIDPDYELSNTNVNAERLRPQLRYLVRSDGQVKFPMIGDIQLSGMTLYEAEAYLQAKYDEYYEKAFVQLGFLNKRVVVLGAPGGQVIPLENERTTLVEVIALSEGIDNFGKGHNIRIMRDEQVFLVDFTTVEGYMQGNMLVEPGDVIYIEPVRRPFTEFIRDNGPIISVFTSLLSLIVVIATVN